MVRQNIYPNTEQRLFEAYMDFSGGLNSEISNERLKVNEYPILQNVDLLGRASAKRRTGRSLVSTVPGTGVAQGIFAFFRSGIGGPDYIAARGGSLYVQAYGTTTWVNVPITDGGSAWTFQTTLPIEAVQYQGSLFVATGTKLVELTYSSGWTAVTSTPYTPTVMEAIYIGTNGLAANPSSYVADNNSGATLFVLGVQPATRTGAANQTTVMTAYISKPASIATVEYKWEYKKSADSAWILGRDWTSSGGKTYNFTPDTATNYDLRVSIRDAAVTTNTSQYVFSGYMVASVASKNDLPVTGIQTCRKILLHWDRILLAGDSTSPAQMYVSDLQNPRYFPVTNTINFDTGKQESINVMIRFQAYLIIMTNTTIQSLLGKDPSTYQRYLIQDTVGCTAGRSAVVVGNQVLFKSFEGIYALRPNPYRVDTMNVARIDVQIRSEVPLDKDACGIFFNNQYWLCFPQKKIVYRYYFEYDVWTKDASTYLNINQFITYSGLVYNLSTDGKFIKHDDTVFEDVDNVYDMIVETKLHDLSASFNNKKLRRLFVIAKHFTTTVNLKVKVYADAALILTPDEGTVTIDANGNTVWTQTTTPNFNFYAGTTLGAWILGQAPLGNAQLSVQSASVNGKCRRIKVNFTHSEAVPCEIYGFGVEFKMKKV
jgi:hypothetical protein